MKKSTVYTSKTACAEKDGATRIDVQKVAVQQKCIILAVIIMNSPVMQRISPCKFEKHEVD